MSRFEMANYVQRQHVRSLVAQKRHLLVGS